MHDDHLASDHTLLISGGPPAQSHKGSILRFSLRIIIAAACLFWVFHDLHPQALWRQMHGIKWGWVGAALCVDFLSYSAQGMRWKLVLKPQGELPLTRAVQGVYVGLFANELMPLRIGELVRAFLIANWLRVDMVAVIPAQVMERLFDGIWLAIGIGVTILLMDMPPELSHAARLLGIIIWIAIAMFIFILLRPQRNIEKSPEVVAKQKTFLRRAAVFFQRTTAGIRQIGRSRYFFTAFLVSSLVLGLQMMAFWLMMIAYGLDLPIWSGAAVFLILTLGIMVPNVPSNIGPYQFFCVLGLSLFEIDKTMAGGFSIVVFILLTVPLWLIGLMAISHTGLTLREIRARLTKAMKVKEIGSQIAP